MKLMYELEIQCNHWNSHDLSKIKMISLFVVVLNVKSYEIVLIKIKCTFDKQVRPICKLTLSSVASTQFRFTTPQGESDLHVI